jgi:hypothetical protein
MMIRTRAVTAALVTVLVTVLVALGFVSVASAQTPTPAVPTSLELIVVSPTGDPQTLPPLGTRSTPISAASCNLPGLPTPPTPLVNPTVGEVSDPFLPVGSGRFCRGSLPTGLPNGVSYRAVATFTGDCGGAPCTSGRSLTGVPPFNLAGTALPPAAPTSLGVRP